MASVSPGSGVAGSAIIISGQDFSSRSIAYLGNEPMKTSWVSFTRLSAVIPSYQLKSGVYDITVQDRGETTPTSSADRFALMLQQTIIFRPLPNVSYPTTPITLTAISSPSGLATSYTVSGPATVSGSTLMVTGAGQITVTAMQSGNGDYVAATQVQQSFTAAASVVAGTTVLSETVTLMLLTNGSYQATVKITNSGTGTAQNVTIAAAALGPAKSLQALPAALANIDPSGSITAVFTFPSTAGAPGAASVLKLGGTYTGGSFAGSIRVTLPPSAS